jgi:hypothetical protein
MEFANVRRPNHLQWLAAVYLVWTLGAVVYFFLDGLIALGPRVEVKPDQIVEVVGKGYRLKAERAQLVHPQLWERAELYEDGKPLFPRVLSMAPVQQKGGGAYHFSSKNLWFSSTDGSDPRTSQKHYVIAFPLALPSAPVVLVRIWAWGWIFLGLALGRPRIAAELRSLAASPWGVIALAVVLVRMILISHDEIVATPSDEQEYLVLAKDWYYHAAPEKYFRLPVYPLFVALASTTGLPLRWIIEGTQLASYALLARALLACGISRWVAYTTFIWMALSPQMGSWNNYSISETLYVAVLVSALALGLMWLSTHRWTLGLGCGVLLALLMNVREERIIGVALGGMLLLFMAWEVWRSPSPVKEVITTPWMRTRFIAVVLAPLLLSWALLDGAFQAAFYARTGVAAHCLLSTPGLVDLMDSLYRIPPQEPPRRTFFLDVKLRNYASTLSPTFHEWQHFWEDEKIGFHARCQRVTGEYDLAPDGFVFTMMWDGIYDEGGPLEPSRREVLMKQIAAEIRQSLAGHEQQRIYMRGTYPVNSTVLALWLHEIGPLLRTSLQWSFPPVMNGPYAPVGPTNQGIIDLFNSLAHRRPALAQIMDTTGDPRPPWIKGAWWFVDQAERICLWLAIGLALLAWAAAACKREWRRRFMGNMCLPAVAPPLILIMLALSRIALGTLVPLFFIDNFERYMVVVPLLSLPIFLLMIEMVTRREVVESEAC